jgi:hypothetical protein
MKNKTKYSITVTECEDLRCPFFYAGHMGGQHCQAVIPKAHFFGDLPDDKSERPPAWCPLKQTPITIRLK